MKQRICLAWFCDLDAQEPTRSKARKDSTTTVSQAKPEGSLAQPKVKEAWELRQMFRRP
jgi:hypothetical protein